jgi:hypothetical protein
MRSFSVTNIRNIVNSKLVNQLAPNFKSCPIDLQLSVSYPETERNAMSTQKQIDANRQNAQHSHGPTSPEGKQRSSLNATKHGLTGQSLVLSPDEQAPYAQFVKDYFEEWQPFDAITRQLTQQLCDAHWSIHQIFVQQSNLLAMINAATVQLNETTDPITAATTVAKLSKTLHTYSIYETRRRRFADAIEDKLTTLMNDRAELIKQELPMAAKIAKQYKTQGKTFLPSDLGFVCSTEQIEGFLKGEALAAACQNTPKSSLPTDLASAEAEIERLLAEELAAERTK